MISPGGELPFLITFMENERGILEGFVINGDESIQFTSIAVARDSVILSFEHYDSSIRLMLGRDGKSMDGWWVKRGAVMMPFTALKNAAERFPLPAEGVGRKTRIDDISGSWNVIFQGKRGMTPATGIFRQSAYRHFYDLHRRLPLS